MGIVSVTGAWKGSTETEAAGEIGGTGAKSLEGIGAKSLGETGENLVPEEIGAMILEGTEETMGTKVLHLEGLEARTARPGRDSYR